MLIGAAIQTSSYSAAQMLVGRIITGLGMGVRLIARESCTPKLTFIDKWCHISHVGGGDGMIAASLLAAQIADLL